MRFKHVIACAAITAAACAAFCTPALAAGNLAAAQKAFSVSDANTVTVEDPSDVVSALSDAGDQASTSEPRIVYLPAGSYETANARGQRWNVPENVVLVGEDATKVEVGYRVTVNGALYGGTYAASGDGRVLLFGAGSFSGINGTIQKATITNLKQKGCYGIVATGGASGVKILDNDVSSCWSGINVFFGAYASKISGNKTHDNSEAGINLVKASAGTIEKNTISGNGKHGISTDTESSGSGPKTCTVDKVNNNKITGNGKKALYVETGYTVKQVSGNTMTGNENGICVEAKAIVKGIAKNNISKNKVNIVSTGSKALAVIGASNKISNASDKGSGNGITLSKGGTVKITGKNNVISGNKKNGISLVGKSTLTITGTGTKVSKNGNMGIGVYEKSKATFKKVTFGKNKKFALYVQKGAKAKYSGCNLSKKVGAANRAYIG